MDLQKLFQDLKEAGQLSDFLTLCTGAVGLFNCHTEAHLTEGPRGNLYVRQMVFEKQGEGDQGEKHHYDHITYLIRGKLVMQTEDGEETFQAPSMILIKKEKWHRFTALTDDVIAHCVYAVRDSEGNFSETYIPTDKPYR